MKGACEGTPFDRAFRFWAWSRAMFRVFRMSRLCNVGDRYVLYGMVSCIGASSGDWWVSGRFGPRWYRALSAPLDVDKYGSFCWWSGLG